jgi:hypothetical protein
MWPGDMGMMSRKARTRGDETIKWHWGSMSSGSGFEGTSVVAAGGYVSLIRQKAHGMGYSSSTVDMIATDSGLDGVRNEWEGLVRYMCKLGRGCEVDILQSRGQTVSVERLSDPLTKPP